MPAAKSATPNSAYDLRFDVLRIAGSIGAYFARMLMTRTRTGLVVSLTVAVGMYFCFSLGRTLHRRVHESDDERVARRMLYEEVKNLLEAHYSSEHRYPETLSALVISEWPTDSSSNMLSRLHYTSDGKSFTLVSEPKGGGTVYIAHGPQEK
jgi:hypothetical protein